MDAWTRNVKLTHHHQTGDQLFFQTAVKERSNKKRVQKE